MDSFLLNQEVNAQMLNDIAIDLGASTFQGFSDSTPTAVSELNGITQALTGRGILQSGNKCAPSLAGTTLTIGTGIVIFATGAKKKVTESISVPVPQTGTTYVYFFNNVLTNTISLIASETAPAAGSDYVKVCEATDGTLSDRREFSVSNVIKDGVHSTETVHIVITEAEMRAKEDGELIKSYQLKSSTYTSVSFYENNYNYGVYSISEDIGFDRGGNYYHSSFRKNGWLEPDSNPILVKIENGCLNVYKYIDNSYVNITFTCR